MRPGGDEEGAGREGKGEGGVAGTIPKQDAVDRSSFWQQSALPKGGTVIHVASQNPFLYCDTFSDLLQCEKWYPCGSKAFSPPSTPCST